MSLLQVHVEQESHKYMTCYFKSFINLSLTFYKQLVYKHQLLGRQNHKQLSVQYLNIVSISNQLKLVSAIFFQIFIFSQNDSPLKTEKCFLFQLKSSFRSRHFQISVFFSLPFHTSRSKRISGSGIIYDVIN